MKPESSQRIFENFSDVKIKKNLFSGSQDVPCRPNIWMGMKKLIVAFHNFVNVPKNSMHLLNTATKWGLV
jgi:hypothetical protein